MSASFRPMSFEAWRDEQIANRPADMKVECPTCDGEGVDECSCCGHERECEGCDGDGHVEWGDLQPWQKERLVSRAAYAAAILEDGVAWASWLGREPAEVLFAAGFRVWSAVTSKTLGLDTGSPEVTA
ncbi:hypothetical protein [Luteimonas colneyensis]|nr:hypothetical protein [Luteimonas colneyensis]